MTNAEMDAVQVHDTPMRLQRTLTPRLKLLREGLVEPTDGTRDFEQLPSAFGPLLPPYGYLSRPRTSASVLRQCAVQYGGPLCQDTKTE